VTDTTVPTAALHQTRPPLWRNTNVLKWGIQIVVLVLTIAAFWFLISQARTNLDAKGIPVGYDWLNNPSNIQVSEGIQTADLPERSLTMGRALWVGMVNTLRVAGAGIIVSTILGLVIGIARLSHNWLAQKIASIYVETLRNIPVLVQILLWFAILTTLGELTTESGPIKGWVIASQKGISIPRVFLADGFYQFMALMVVFGVGIWFVRRYLHRKQDEEGGEQHVGSITLGLTTIAVVIAWFANPVMSWVGTIFDKISGVWADIPEFTMQLALSALAVLAATWWIKRFLDSRRTPAGLAKLTDDDIFRMIFAGVAALIGALVFLVMWPGLSSWIVHSGSDFWGVLGDKFGGGRGSRPLDAMKPTLTEGRFVNYGPTGLTMSVFFASLFFGLVFYTSSFIAEIVRGGILAVPKGQSEAAAALGLSRSQSLRKVVLPQAFRVIMPPLGNQYLNITKNTSLGIAVGFSEIVQVGQTIYNKNNQTLAVFSIYMVFFLACSLTISAVVNYINGRLAIVER
jgi:general L-amino acid transport system permease protein